MSPPRPPPLHWLTKAGRGEDRSRHAQPRRAHGAGPRDRSVGGRGSEGSPEGGLHPSLHGGFTPVASRPLWEALRWRQARPRSRASGSLWPYAEAGPGWRSCRPAAVASQGAGTFQATWSLCRRRQEERREVGAESRVRRGEGWSWVLSSSGLGHGWRGRGVLLRHRMQENKKETDRRTHGLTEGLLDTPPAVSGVPSQHALGPGTATSVSLPCVVLRPQRTVHFVLLLMFTSFFS